MTGMKNRLWFWMANILFAGCSGGDESGGPAKLDLEYPEPLAGIIDKAVDVDELDDSQLKDDFFSYTLYEPNEKTPDSGWIKRIFRGKVTLLAEVEDGTLNGTSILFDEDGSKSSESTYLQGVLHGPHAEFLPDGGKILEEPTGQARNKALGATGGTTAPSNGTQTMTKASKSVPSPSTIRTEARPWKAI